MSKFRNALCIVTVIGASVVGLAGVTGVAQAGTLGLGRAALPAEIAAWDTDIRPDGQGLPPGQGSVTDGDEIFANQCAACHGDFGEGIDRWPVLAGGNGTLATANPVKTVGSFWPYLSTVYDYIKRAMPFGYASSLSDDEVYAVVAYILYLNDIVDEDFVLTQENFTSVEMPNTANFYPDDRETTELPIFHDACMSDCKTSVEVTGRARILDVTPETETQSSVD